MEDSNDKKIWLPVFLLCLFFHLLFKAFSKKVARKELNLPPGPAGWPLIGHLYLLPKLNHRGLYHLSQKHGPIMFLQLYSVKTLVVSNLEMAEIVLKKLDHICCSRPKTSASENLLYGSSDLSFSPYGPRWRLLRKICAVELLGSSRIKAWMPFISHQIGKVMVERILEESQRSRRQDGAVDLRKVIYEIVSSIFCGLVLGENQWEETKGLKELVSEYSYLLAVGDMGDFVPWLASLDLQGHRRRQKIALKKANDIYGRVIDEHIARKGREKKDFVDALLEHQSELSRDLMKALIIDMIHAGIDTTYSTIDWAMAELLKNPQVMKKAQHELLSMVGSNEKVTEDDMHKLGYIKAVVNETLRIHPAAPLLLPHYSVEDCTMAGYWVPSGTQVIVNAWALGQDPVIWSSDVDKFKPERFLEEGSLEILMTKMVPFGLGRRMCPGKNLGSTVLELVLMQLLHCFNWSVKDENNLDMSEELDLTLHRASPLFVTPIPRSPAFSSNVLS